MSDYNYAVDRMCETLALIELGCLCLTKDKTGKEMGMPDVNKFYELILETKAETLSMPVDEVISLIKNDYPYIYEISQKISTNAYISMARIDKRDRKWLNANFRKSLQLGFCMAAMWTDKVLKNEFRLRTPKRKDFFERVQDMIYGYQNKMVTMEMMNQAFIDDLGYDVIKGIEVDNGKCELQKTVCDKKAE